MNSNDEQLDVPWCIVCPQDFIGSCGVFCGQFQEIEIDSDHLKKRSPINDDILWYSMIVYDILWYSMIFYDSYDLWYASLLPQEFLWYSMIHFHSWLPFLNIVSLFKSNLDFVGVYHHFVEFWDIFWPQLAWGLDNGTFQWLGNPPTNISLWWYEHTNPEDSGLGG